MINAGIIGYGKIGKVRHKEIIDMKEYNLVAITEPFNKIDIEGINIYKDYKNMLDTESLDCVFVCVPHSMTTDIVIDALNRGLHVFAEKPPGVNSRDVERIRSALSDGTKLKFGFNHRYHSHIQEAKKVITSGKLGKIQWIKGTYGRVELGKGWRTEKDTGCHGILFSQGIHMVDLFRYLCDTEFDVQKSLVSHFNNHWYEDNVFALLHSTEKNIDCMIHSSCVMRRNVFLIYIGMEKGYIRIENLITSTRSFGFPEELCVANSSKTYFYGNPQKVSTFYGIDNSWKLEVEEFADAIINDKPIRYGTIDDATEIMKILDDIYEV